MTDNLMVLDLFAGAGGFTLAGEMAGGYSTVAFCESRDEPSHPEAIGPQKR